MKISKLTILFILILLFLPLRFATAVDAQWSFDPGWLMQKGEVPAFSYGVKADIGLPFFQAMRTGQPLNLDATIMHSEFKGEVNYLKGYLIYERPLFTIAKSQWYLAFGTGAWQLITDGDDVRSMAQTVRFGVNVPHFTIGIAGEVAEQPGDLPKLYNVSLTIRSTI